MSTFPVGRRIPITIALCAAVLALGALAIAPHAQAASQATVATPWVELHVGRVRLIAGPVAGDGGEITYLAGVEIALEDGWKTYWRMPGDAGVPPHFNWAASANTASITVLYPAPVRLIEPAAQSIGYKGTVIFPVEVRSLDAAKPVELNLELELGICREICIPGEVKLSLQIPMGLSGASPIAAWRARVPRPQAARRTGDPKLERVVAKLDGASPRLLFEATFPGGGKNIDVFVEARDGLYVPMTSRLPDGPGGIVRFEANLARVDAHDLKGKELTVTLVGESGAATEATWLLK